MIPIRHFHVLRVDRYAIVSDDYPLELVVDRRLVVQAVLVVAKMPVVLAYERFQEARRLAKYSLAI
jgi:hypothetical protein